MKLNIGNNSFSVKVADTDLHRKRGLKRVNGDSIPKDSGLVLKYNKAQNVPITMQDMTFPLDLVFIKDNKVINISQANPGDKDVDIKTEVDNVLELKRGGALNLKVGDEVSWVGSREGNQITMADGGLTPEGELQLLDEDGKVQMNLDGVERVFSRIHTKQLYDLSKKAKDPSHYRSIGRAMVRMLNKQNTQKQQHTDG